MAVSAYTSTTSRARKTPQSEAMIGETQVKNSAGGYVYQLDKFKTLERFLVLGTEGGTFYVKEQKLTKDSAKNVLACLKADYVRTVDTIVAVSDAGRAPRNTPAEFALALAAADERPEVRAYALAALPKVCRIPTHLYHFMQFVTDLRGFSRGLRNGITRWLDALPTEKLAYEFVKYQSRDGWSGGDVLRLAHPSTTDPVRNAVYRWMLGKDRTPMTVTRGKGADARVSTYPGLVVKMPDIIEAYETAKDYKNDPAELVKLIQRYKLTREMLPTEGLQHAEVWRALLEAGMPLTALIRNLGNLGARGVLTPMSSASKLVVERLSDGEALRKSRVHPMAILIALKTYESGRGMRGDNTWKPVPAVVDALDEAFYASFKNVEPTGKRLLYGVDVSGSMSCQMSGFPITSAECAGAMALISAKTEKDYYIHGFAGTFVDLGITPKMRLDEACRRVQKSNFGSTDAAVPFTWALKNKVDVDAVVVITDNETWCGDTHVKQALKAYRDGRGIAAKEVVMATTATEFTIADPKDPLTLDVVGFDTTAPAVIADFVRS